MDQPPLLLFLDLAGTVVFAVNGALVAIRATRLDIVGVVTLGMLTGLGGGTIRDVLLGALPPATFIDWRYLATATIGGLVAFALSHRLERLGRPIDVLDAIGLGVFAVIGASKAIALDFGVAQALIVGVITAVGGGTLRDALILRVPPVLRNELYAIPALVAAVITVALLQFDVYSVWTALGAAAVCVLIRLLGLRYDLHAPEPPNRHQGELIE